MRELATTGKAVLIGGSGLVLALAIVAVIGPTQLMVSLGAGMLTGAAFATGGAVVVMQAALVLLGRRIGALSFPAPAPLQRAWSHLDGSVDTVTGPGAINATSSRSPSSGQGFGNPSRPPSGARPTCSS
jgi:hypothetical protein